jgi:hypothetical protein
MPAPLMTKEIVMCCGSRRAAWRGATAMTSRAPAVGPAPASPRPAVGGPPVQSAFPTVLLDYAEARSIRVRGPVTGQAYAFAAAGPPQPVDARDAAVLTRNRSFRPA